LSETEMLHSSQDIDMSIAFTTCFMWSLFSTSTFLLFKTNKTCLNTC